MNNQLIISGYSIKQDLEGRFCLNDLHKAAGNESRHQPAKWLITQQSIELVEHLKASESITGIPVIFSKQGLGTFAVKPLVYAYAMWISPIFHLHVIEAYDALVTGQVPDHVARAYDELVANKIPEYLKIITAPLTMTEFEERYHFHENMLESLKNAQIIMSAREFLNIKQGVGARKSQ